MKKVMLLILLLLICIIGALSYRNYVISKTGEYIRFVENMMNNGPFKSVEQQDIQVERIIKRTPFELIVIIKWGENDEAYVSVENWLTRAHDHIEIRPFDAKRKVIIYE